MIMKRDDAEDGAVDGDQRQEDAQREVERRREALDDHLHELDEGGDDDDEDDEFEVLEASGS